MRAAFTAALVASSLTACAEPTPPRSPSSRDTRAGTMPIVDEGAQPLTKLPAAQASYRPMSMCELLVGYHHAAGEFVVTELVSRMEHDPLSGTPQPFAYARLEAVDEWTADEGPQERVLRLRGGAYPDGTLLGGLISLEVGQHLVGFFRQADDENEGYLQAIGPTVFHEMASGGLTNGALFVNDPISAADLRHLFEVNVKPDFACREDVVPERARSDRNPSPPAEDGPLTPLPEGAE